MSILAATNIIEIHPIDIGIIAAYLVVIVIAGFLVSRRASQSIKSYFLGGNTIPWYFLGVANASGMFDITGTMWMVAVLFIYGLKSAWIPWLWPTFNQVFLMIYLAVWLRRSKVMTGAEWIRTRFGDRLGGELSHISVVLFALLSVVGMLAYAFQGIGKFAAIFFPWDLSFTMTIPGFEPANISSANMYALLFMGVATIYVIVGGMYSVVLTDLIQFTILTIASLFIAGIAMSKASPDMIAAVSPQGWEELFFGWRLNLDWSNILPQVNDAIIKEGYSLFGIFFMMILLKGILASMAGPAPNYDMQRILATRSPKESALMSWFTSTVLFLPRYMMIAGITVLALVFFKELNLIAADGSVDFEQVLPSVIHSYIPAGLVGLILAGLLAAFMSTFDCTVNAGASYIANDIYKRYIHRNASEKVYVRISYVSSILLVLIGVSFGFYVESIDKILKWITAGLYAGYVIPNVLKWYWWRFNGYGYFAGMIAGIVSATLFSEVASAVLYPNLTARFHAATDNFSIIVAAFPIIAFISAAASIITSLLTKPDDEETLKNFYRTVRPWGFWKPIHKKVVAEHPEFLENRNFKRDMTNVAVGIVWQMPLAVIPIFLVIREYKAMWISIAVLLVTSIFLKKNWYDKLETD